MTALQHLRPFHNKPVQKNRWPGILFAVVLHILGIYALTTAPSHPAVALPQQNTQAVVFTELPKNDLSPPLLPDFKPPPLVTVLPEIEINLSEVALPATTPTKPASAAATTHAPTDMPSTLPVPITSHAVTSDDDPDQSIRLAEQGLVKIEYLVQSDGTVSECTVITSSGSSRLDVAACTMVKRRWRFRPATQNGKPVAEYLQADVSFTLVPSFEN
jgi:protein TonB